MQPGVGGDDEICYNTRFSPKAGTKMSMIGKKQAAP